MPTGGVIRPISHITTTKTPNQIGSKPRCMMTGKMIGTVRMIMVMYLVLGSVATTTAVMSLGISRQLFTGAQQLKRF